jgi:serine protease
MWMVKMMPIKVLNADGEGSDADIAAGIQYAVTNHAKVINASFGGYSYSSTLYDAIAAANSAGILLVAAAGNEGVNNDLTPNYPSSYDLPNIIAVAATDQDDRRVPFSNFGPLTVDVAAPGTYVLSTIPLNLYSDKEFNSGTSMAAPHVTGLAGLLYSYYYNLNSTQIRNMILTYVDILPSLDGWIATKGRINAFRSMSALWEPFDLTLNQVSAYQVNLSWTDRATAESNYIVERKEQGGTYAGLATLGPNVNAYYDNSNFKDGTKYYYRLRLKNWIGESPGVIDNERSIITVLNPPTHGHSGGGGGCSIGTKQNTPTSLADASVMLLPLLVIAVLRRRR